MTHYLRLEFLILCILAFTCGAASSFAMAPYHWWILLFPALSGLYLLLLRCASFRGGLGIGWAYGFGFFIFSLSWIGNALLVEGNQYAWAWPLAVCALPASLALFPGLACGFSAKFLNLRTLSGFFGFCAVLALSEWLRGHIFTGFPWNLLAYAWGENLPLLQSLHLIDIYTLSLFVTALAAIPALCIALPRKPAPLIAGIVLLLCTISLYLYGEARLKSSPLKAREDVVFKIVQPDIAQHEKWDSLKIAEHFREQIEMSMPTEQDPPGVTTIVLWPETALHYLFLRDKGSLGYISSMLDSYEGPAFLVTGALIRDSENKTYTNSVVSIDKTGTVATRYDKFHLVPFGEYIPFQQWIPLETVTRFTGFIRGDGPQTQSLPLPGDAELKFSPLVCYEILFPDNVIDPDHRPDVIINVTNDGWYGFSAGPHQHLLKARFRAIEEGTPVIRSANNGISGIIDPYGRIIVRSDLFVKGVYNAPLPESTPELRYIFNIKKEWLFWGFIAILGGWVLYTRKSANSEL